jgi:hypothetical protein
LVAVAFETALGFERRLRAIPRQRMTVEPDPHLVSEPEPSNAEIELWEMHSELALVCPKVRRCARERLAERDPDAFLERPRAPISPSSDTAHEAPYPESFSLAVLGYTLWRLAETARTALLALGAVVALALLAQLLH